ncbi:siderophore-interacting protein [Candidatus Marinarcus aquaticus]|uniref:Siderophore-interacting protein n=2 Tax=Candidatus Marinarcus aquaticus TaxID=2044504 RepID=A0A4Q0XW60_9BACT|nr:siderophore-interacting protein [Candidatus Marinarcus aquaticus]
MFNEQKTLLAEIDELPEEFLQELKSEVKENREKINQTKRRKKLFLKSCAPLLVAASVLFVIYISFFAQRVLFSNQYLASNKILKDIQLPDYSKVTLDVNTHMDVQYYATSRKIKLSNGKAVFDVFSNKKRPFTIATNRVHITVLGTKFEVVNHQQQTQVNVKEGVVKVSLPKENDRLLALVNKGESLILDKSNNIISLSKTNSDDMALWSEGKFAFYQESIEHILKEFSKYLDVEFSIENKTIAQLPVSGNFNVNHFDDFLMVLPLIHPINVQKKENKIIITHRQ